MAKTELKMGFIPEDTTVSAHWGFAVGVLTKPIRDTKNVQVHACYFQMRINHRVLLRYQCTRVLAW